MKKIFFLFLFVGSVFLLPSCDDDSGSVDCVEIANRLFDDLEPLSDAQEAYTLDPSAANCATLKGILSDYIDLAKDGRKCVPDEDKAEYNDAIDILEVELANLPC